jgi:hypothetical protein
MDRKMLNHLYHQNEVGSFQFRHLLVVVNLVEPQNLVGPNLGVDLTCQAVVRLVLVEQVDVELRHQLRKDYFQDAVVVELRQLLRKDYCLGVVLA